jgi:hypothetical protein
MGNQSLSVNATIGHYDGFILSHRQPAGKDHSRRGDGSLDRDRDL